MKCCSLKNLTRFESSFRIVSGALLMVAGALWQNYLVMGIAVILILTGYKHFCPLYDFFGINLEVQKRNRYAAILPKYRNSPVMVFDKEGRLLYTNDHGQKLAIEDAGALGFEDVGGIVARKERSERYFEWEEKHYKLDYVGDGEDGLLLVYFNDVTQLINLSEEIERTQREIIGGDW